MKTRTLLLVAAAAVLALVAATWLSRSRSPEDASRSPGVLAPELSGLLDQITEVRIRAAGDVTLATLTRSGTTWGLKEKDGYPVDVEKLRGLLSALAGARRVEAKTAQAERHAQLGVEDIAAADARGVEVDIDTPTQRFAFILGDNPVRGDGTYVRIAGDAQSWLVAQSIAVERIPANWLVKQIIDVGANRIHAISVVPVEGPAITLERGEGNADSDFVLKKLPRGREPAANYQREALAGFLSGLGFDDVFPATAQPVSEKVRTSVFDLDDGRSVHVVSWEHDGHTWARFGMELDPTRADAWLARPLAQAEAAPAALADTSAGASTTAAETPTDASSPRLTRADLEAQVARFQREHGDWVYQLPAFKAANLNKALEDYLKPKA